MSLRCASCDASPAVDAWQALRRVNVKGRPGVFLCGACDPTVTPAPAQERPTFDFHPPGPDTADAVVHDAMKDSMRRIAAVIGEGLPEGCGFTLFVFQYGPGGWLTYLSSADREDVRALLTEWLATQARA